MELNFIPHPALFHLFLDLAHKLTKSVSSSWWTGSCVLEQRPSDTVQGTGLSGLVADKPLSKWKNLDKTTMERKNPQGCSQRKRSVVLLSEIVTIYLFCPCYVPASATLQRTISVLQLVGQGFILKIISYKCHLGKLKLTFCPVQPI